MLEAALDAVVAIDHQGRITEFNPSAERMFGYRRHEVVGRPMVEVIVPGSLRDQHRRGFARFLATGVSRILGRILEMRALRSDGTEFPVELFVARIDLPGPPSFTGYIRDISDRKRAEEALGQAMERRRLLETLLVESQEEERKRIAWDIHDDSIQSMATVALRLQALRRRVQDPAVAEGLKELEATVGGAIGRLRHLLFELRPMILDREGLVPALRAYLEEMGKELGLAHSLTSGLPKEPPLETAVTLYRLAQEALANVRKHSRAGRVDVALEERDGGVAMSVRDDGIGFTPGAGHPPKGHIGVAAMRERAEIFGGWCRVESAPGSGTTVAVWLPVAASRRKG